MAKVRAPRKAPKEIAIPKQTYELEFPELPKPPFEKEGWNPYLTEPNVSVILDAGAFRVAMEAITAATAKNWPYRGSMGTCDALIRATRAFRQAYWTTYPTLTPKTEIPPNSRIIRKEK